MSNSKDIYFDGENKNLLELSLVLVTATKKILRQKGDIYLSAEPDIHEKEIVQFARRMRVDGLEKFGVRTVVASVNFYLDKNHMDHEQAIGVLVLYIPQEYIARLMWLMDYGRIKEDDDGESKESCGAVANLIAGCFVNELSANGYVFLQMSHFATYINTAVDGIDFYPQENVKHEIEFFIRDEKRLVAELSMGHLKKY